MGMMGGMGMMSGKKYPAYTLKLPNKKIGIMDVKDRAGGGVDMYIASNMIKYLIGKKGSTIREMSTATGCDLTAQNKEDANEPNQKGTRFSIKGPSSNVETCLSVIREKLQNIRDTLNPPVIVNPGDEPLKL